MTATKHPQWQVTQQGDDFADTALQAREDNDSRWWSEAADGHRSEDAGRFAASLTAALSIV